MTKILSAALSIGASLIISWAALHYDIALLVTGLAILLVVTLIWIFAAPVELGRSPAAPLRNDEPAVDLDREARALFYLERARENGYTAHASRSRQQIEQSLSEIMSALRGVAITYSFGPVSLEVEGIGRRRILGLVLQYIDSFYFLLRQGHVAEARRLAGNFQIG